MHSTQTKLGRVWTQIRVEQPVLYRVVLIVCAVYTYTGSISVSFVLMTSKFVKKKLIWACAPTVKKR